MTDGDIRRERHNPLELIEYFWPGISIDHITYDPKLRQGDYYIIRQRGHDGTLWFTHEMLKDGLIDIAHGQGFYKKTEPPDWSQVQCIEYVIGPMRHVTVFGMIHLRCSRTQKYPGQRERIRMPVKCKYILKTEAVT